MIEAFSSAVELDPLYGEPVTNAMRFGLRKLSFSVAYRPSTVDETMTANL